MSFSYANPGSGPSAGGIGWFNFDSLSLNPGDSAIGLTGTLNNGYTVTFDIQNIPASFTSFTANPVPTFPGSNFGANGYTGLLGNVALKTPLHPAYPTSTTLVLSNIVVKDTNLNVVTNYTAVVADAESTNSFPQYTESLVFNTNGGNWSLLDTIGGNPPILAGVGTPIVTITGTNQGIQAAYVFTTQSPTTLSLETVGREAVAIGFATTTITLEKNIGQRIDSTDQFVLDIAGVPNDQATTTGISNGIQVERAVVNAIPGNVYTINEAMAPGSASALGDYIINTTAMNATPNGSIPPIGALPINVIPQLGDDITYLIVNAAPETFTKSVDKQYAEPGEILTYTVVVNNPNDFAVNNVLVTDATPMGTTYVGNLLVNAPFTGTDPATGITITTIPANGSVTMSWQVQVMENIMISQVDNVASVNVPGGASGNTNIVSTVINSADLSTPGNIIKVADKQFAEPGDIVTYTITLNNTGNVSANNVVITDIVPAGTTYVPNSTTSTIPFTGDPTSTISLNAPIIAGGNAVVTFQVKIDNGFPTPNPIPNTADVDYTYTVDPADPNGVAATGTSNTVNTLVSQAILTLNKIADKDIAYIGDVITYNITVKNTGNVPADNVIITDIIPNGTTYIPGSLIVTAPFAGTPATGISITNPIDPQESVNITFQVEVIAIPNPNPIENQATSTFDYTVHPLNPNGASGTSSSNIVNTLIFKNNYKQEINDLIQAIALEQAALAAIADQEGAKIQKAVSIIDVTPQQLLCINKSVQDMLDSITNLESLLKQKLNIVNCQINGCICC